MTKIPPPRCQECGAAAEVVPASVFYPGRADLAKKWRWRCPECGAHCGCHGTSKKPLGRPCGPELRRARGLLHEKFDEIWRRAPDYYQNAEPSALPIIRSGARARCHHWLAMRLQIPFEECHIALFDLERCRAAWRAIGRTTYPEIRAWAKERKRREKAEGGQARDEETGEEGTAAEDCAGDRPERDGMDREDPGLHAAAARPTPDF